MKTVKFLRFTPSRVLKKKKEVFNSPFPGKLALKSKSLFRFKPPVC